jgi:PIN like domain
MQVPALSDLRYVFDEDARGVGLWLNKMRTDMTCVGSKPVDKILPLGIKDPEWIPIVGDAGWVVITKNAAIRTHPIESPLAIKHGLRVACLTETTKPTTRWDLARMLLRHWDVVEQLATEAGPSWVSLYSDRTRRRAYEPGQPERARPGLL